MGRNKFKWNIFKTLNRQMFGKKGNKFHAGMMSPSCKNNRRRTKDSLNTCLTLGTFVECFVRSFFRIRSFIQLCHDVLEHVLTSFVTCCKLNREYVSLYF